MGLIQSASTVFANCYLTSTGRDYLFDKNNIRFSATGQDLFQITQFSLGDTDTNYALNYILASGEVPDISGNQAQCLKTADDSVPLNMLYWTFSALSNVSPSYSCSLLPNNNILAIDTNNANNFPVNQASDVPPTGPNNSNT